NGTPDLAIPPDLNTFHEHGILNLGITVDPDIGRDDGTFDLPARDNGTVTDNGVQHHADALAVLTPGEDHLCRREGTIDRMHRPVRMIKVTLGGDGYQVHVGLVVGIERSDVAPVAISHDALKWIYQDLVVLNHARDDVLAEIM